MSRPPETVGARSSNPHLEDLGAGLEERLKQTAFYEHAAHQHYALLVEAVSDLQRRQKMMDDENRARNSSLEWLKEQNQKVVARLDEVTEAVRVLRDKLQQTEKRVAAEQQVLTEKYSQTSDAVVLLREGLSSLRERVTTDQEALEKEWSGQVEQITDAMVRLKKRMEADAADASKQHHKMKELVVILTDGVTQLEGVQGEDHECLGLLGREVRETTKRLEARIEAAEALVAKGQAQAQALAVANTKAGPAKPGDKNAPPMAATVAAPAVPDARGDAQLAESLEKLEKRVEEVEAGVASGQTQIASLTGSLASVQEEAARLDADIGQLVEAFRRSVEAGERLRMSGGVAGEDAASVLNLLYAAQ
eukprot:jgi/Mesvir1/10962/Mv07849-RA.1